MDDFLIYLGYIILLINLVLYSISFFRKEKANIFLVLYIAFCSFMQFAMEILYQFAFKNLLVVNIFFIGQFVLLGLFFKSLCENKMQKKCMQISMFFFLFLLVCQYIYDYKFLFEFNLFSITITSLFLVCNALMHLYNQLTTEKKYYFITIGVIIYMLSSTVLYLIGNLTNGLSSDLKYLSWRLNAFLFIVYHLFILYEWKASFFKNKKIS
jgi:hypothetical protein